MVNSVVFICAVADNGQDMTVATPVAKQPVPKRYVIVTVPGDTPDIAPETGSIVAMVPSLQAQVPPGVAEIRVSELPMQIM